MASLTEPDNSLNPRELTDRDLSQLTKTIPCGDKTFRQHFVIEGLQLTDCELKRIVHDKRDSEPVRRFCYIFSSL